MTAEFQIINVLGPCSLLLSKNAPRPGPKVCSLASYVLGSRLCPRLVSGALPCLPFAVILSLSISVPSPSPPQIKASTGKLEGNPLAPPDGPKLRRPFAQPYGGLQPQAAQPLHF